MSKKKYWIGKRNRFWYTLMECGQKPKRRKGWSFYWPSPANVLDDFCAEDFEKATGVKLRSGEVRRISWRIWR